MEIYKKKYCLRLLRRPDTKIQPRMETWGTCERSKCKSVLQSPPGTEMPRGPGV